MSRVSVDFIKTMGCRTINGERSKLILLFRNREVSHSSASEPLTEQSKRERVETTSLRHNLSKGISGQYTQNKIHSNDLSTAPRPLRSMGLSDLRTTTPLTGPAERPLEGTVDYVEGLPQFFSRDNAHSFSFGWCNISWLVWRRSIPRHDVGARARCKAEGVLIQHGMRTISKATTEARPSR